MITEEEKASLKEEIVEALCTCYDPEIPVDIYKLGLIYDIAISDDAGVKITMTLTSPNCPAAQSLPAEVKHKAAEVEGVQSVEVDIVFEPPWTPEKMDDAAKLVLNIL
jgi:FeS assembly SUF system protein